MNASLSEAVGSSTDARRQLFMLVIHLIEFHNKRLKNDENVKENGQWHSHSMEPDLYPVWFGY